jgi:hypothetical protein
MEANKIATLALLLLYIEAPRPPLSSPTRPTEGKQRGAKEEELTLKATRSKEKGDRISPCYVGVTRAYT